MKEKKMRCCSCGKIYIWKDGEPQQCPSTFRCAKYYQMSYDEYIQRLRTYDKEKKGHRFKERD